MRLVVESQYFGNISYIKNIVAGINVEILYLHDYKKRHFLNRAELATANGVLKIIVPLEKGRNQQTVFKDVRIANSEQWQARHWKTISSAYNGSPWFFHYRDELASLYLKRFDFLLDWNLETFRWINEKLSLGLTVHLSPSTQQAHSVISPASDLPVYPQVFQERHGFLPNLCVLDLLFCMGPNAALTLLKANGQTQ